MNYERPEKKAAIKGIKFSSVQSREALAELANVETVDELVRKVGPLTEEEKTKLADPHLHDDPTPEKLAVLGPDFAEEVTKRADEIKKIRRHNR